jgi:transposase
MPLVAAAVQTVRSYSATIAVHIAVTIVIQVFTCTLWRRILRYVYIEEKAALGKRDTKTERLRQQGALNRHPETVGASWFQAGGFFDARDLVQVKYEMLRHVRVDGVQKASAATLFGVSRPTFYQAEAAFAQEGLAGLLPKPRGPKSAHKLTPEVMAFIETQQGDGRSPGARSLARQIRAALGLSVHPRSIERALARKKKR